MSTCEKHNCCVIVYDSINCPMCELEDLYAIQKDKVDELKDEIINLKELIDE